MFTRAAGRTHVGGRACPNSNSAGTQEGRSSAQRAAVEQYASVVERRVAVSHMYLRRIGVKFTCVSSTMSRRVSTVHKYKAEELGDDARALLKLRAKEQLGVTPFDWQIDAALSILRGEDTVIDVGTGCGKSICFSLPLLLDEKDTALVVSPLSALMRDQVRKRALTSPALYAHH